MKQNLPKAKDLRKLTRDQLIEKKKEVTYLLLGAHLGVNPPVKVNNQKKNVKRLLARINTLLNESVTPQ